MAKVGHFQYLALRPGPRQLISSLLTYGSHLQHDYVWTRTRWEPPYCNSLFSLSLRLNQSQRYAFSVASLSLLITLFLVDPFSPSCFSASYADFEMRPLAPTSRVQNLTMYASSLRSATRLSLNHLEHVLTLHLQFVWDHQLEHHELACRHRVQYIV